MENCHDGKVVARIAYICDERNSMMDNSENDVAYLLNFCPVKKKTRRSRKRPQIPSLAEDIQGGLNEDSHDCNVASVNISSGEVASGEEESNKTEYLSNDESFGSDSESDDKVPSDDEIPRVVKKALNEEKKTPKKEQEKDAKELEIIMKALSGVAPNCDVAKDAARKLHTIIKRRRASS